MTFLDDVDSLKAKVGIGSTSPLVLFGLSAVIIAVVLSIGFMAWGSFTSSGIVVEHSEKSTQSQEYENPSSQLIYVHIAGEVSNPGMYELKHDARVSDAIDAAGGLTETPISYRLILLARSQMASRSLCRPISKPSQEIASRPALLVADSLHHRILRFCRAR